MPAAPGRTTAIPIDFLNLEDAMPGMPGDEAIMRAIMSIGIPPLPGEFILDGDDDEGYETSEMRYVTPTPTMREFLMHNEEKKLISVDLAGLAAISLVCYPGPGAAQDNMKPERAIYVKAPIVKLQPGTKMVLVKDSPTINNCPNFVKVDPSTSTIQCIVRPAPEILFPGQTIPSSLPPALSIPLLICQTSLRRPPHRHRHLVCQSQNHKGSVQRYPARFIPYARQNPLLSTQSPHQTCR
jgi:hypothetical protein